MNELKKPNKLKIRLFLDLMKSPEIKEPVMSYADGINELKNNEEDYPRMEKVFLNVPAGSSLSAEFKEFLFLDVFFKKFNKA